MIETLPTKRNTEIGAKKGLTAEQVELAFVTLALCNGNSKKAALALRNTPVYGFKVDPTSLRAWRDKDPERYVRTQERLMPEIRARAGDAYATLSELQAEVATEATERLQKELPNVPIERLPQAVQQTTLASGISTDKAREYRGEATVVHEHRDAKQILRRLKSRGVVVDAEVVSEETVPNAS